jgi:hypothetical protein
MNRCMREALFFFAAGSCCAQVEQMFVTDDLGYGKVEWTKTVITVRVVGHPNQDLPAAIQRTAAMSAAQEMALQKAQETVESIFFDATNCVKESCTKNSAAANSLRDFLKGCETQSRTRELNNGAFETTLEIPCTGRNALFDIMLAGRTAERTLKREGSDPRNETRSAVSGLIIDARSLKVHPAIAPRILDEKRNVIYDASQVSHAWAIRYGIAGYTKSVEEAYERSERIGTHPLRVKAKKVEGKNATDVVIAERDVAEVLASSKKRQLFSEGRVIVVINGEAIGLSFHVKEHDENGVHRW